MEALVTLLQNIQQLDTFNILFVATSTKEFQELVERLNLQEQLFKKGIDSEGNVIGFYSEATEAINPEKKAGTPFTLRDSGQFYESYDIFVTENEIILDAERDFPDAGAGEPQDIIAKFGIDIIGLTDENHNKTIDFIKDNLIEILLQEIFRGV